jgi:hypothetical protein
MGRVARPITAVRPLGSRRVLTRRGLSSEPATVGCASCNLRCLTEMDCLMMMTLMSSLPHTRWRMSETHSRWTAMNHPRGGHKPYMEHTCQVQARAGTHDMVEDKVMDMGEEVAE